MGLHLVRQQSTKIIRLPCIGVCAPSPPLPYPPLTLCRRIGGCRKARAVPCRRCSVRVVSGRVRLGGACRACRACRRGRSAGLLVVWQTSLVPGGAWGCPVRGRGVREASVFRSNRWGGRRGPSDGIFKDPNCDDLESGKGPRGTGVTSRAARTRWGEKTGRPKNFSKSHQRTSCTRKCKMCSISARFKG